MKYISIGKDMLRSSEFYDAKNDDRPGFFKSVGGGLWLTDFDENNLEANMWMSYLLNDNRSLFYRLYGPSAMEIPCSIVQLKDDASIFRLDSQEKFDELLREHPYQGGKFSYKSLRLCYDAMRIKLFFCNQTDMWKEFGVNSTLLFNLDCIDYYNPGRVVIDDLSRIPYEGSLYHIEPSDVKKKVLKK